MKVTIPRVLSLAAALALTGGLASAQPPQGTPPGMEQDMQQAAPSFSDQDLDRFASSYRDIRDIRDEYAAQLEGVSDPDAAHEIQMEANEKMIEKINENGMSVEEYNGIAQAMQQDPELLERVTSRID